MDSGSATYEVVVEQYVAAPAQRAYEAWLTPADWDSWFTHDSEIDARVGGRYVNGDGDNGEYLELIPGRLLRFTWEHSHACPGTEVAVEFTPQADGSTLMRLTHSGLARPETGRGEMIDGWGWALSNLAAYLEGRPGMEHDAWVAKKYGDSAGD